MPPQGLLISVIFVSDENNRVMLTVNVIVLLHVGCCFLKTKPNSESNNHQKYLELSIVNQNCCTYICSHLVRLSHSINCTRLKSVNLLKTKRLCAWFVLWRHHGRITILGFWTIKKIKQGKHCGDYYPMLFCSWSDIVKMMLDKWQTIIL